MRDTEVGELVALFKLGASTNLPPSTFHLRPFAFRLPPLNFRIAASLFLFLGRNHKLPRYLTYLRNTWTATSILKADFASRPSRATILRNLFRCATSSWDSFHSPSSSRSPYRIPRSPPPATKQSVLHTAEATTLTFHFVAQSVFLIMALLMTFRLTVVLFRSTQ